MKVAIDTSTRHLTRAGTTRYLNGLLGGFQALPGVAFHEIVWPVDNFAYRQPARALKTFYRELVWAPLVAPGLVRQSGGELFHAPAGYLIDPPAGVPFVATLHDFAVLRHGERFRAWHRARGRSRCKKICAANRIIAISDFTASEAMELLGVPASKLERVLHGCDFRSDSPESTPGEFAVPDEFFLFVGSLEPGKNLALLRQVYLLAGSRGVSIPPLVVVGARWEGVRHEGEWPGSWIAAGRIPDEQLVHLYRRAIAHVFPSKYEGFGFTPLEAMTLGCPVICSRVASIPEVAGEAALYAEQTPEAYLGAMLRVLEEDGLRGDLIQRGYQQAAKFSWEKCARETLQVYKKVIG